MNLVSVLKDQLAGEAGKKIGSMIGANESDMSKMVGLGLPSLLSGLGAVASTKDGADKLAKTIGGMDLSNLTDLGKILGGASQSGGGSLLGGLLGGKALEGIASAIAKFTGLDPKMVSMGLTYVAPLVLGAVGSSFKGGKPDAAGITKLFDEQKDNIAAAMPQSFSLDSIPGLSNLGSSVSHVAQQVSEQATAGSSKLLIPGILFVAIAGAAAVYLNLPGKPDQEEITIVIPKNNTGNTGDPNVSRYPSSMSASNPKTAENLGVEGLQKSFTETLGGLATKLQGITDSAGADESANSIQEAIGSIDKMGKSLALLPAEGKAAISKLISSQLETLNPLIEKIVAIPGIGDAVKQLLVQLKEKLTGLVG